MSKQEPIVVVDSLIDAYNACDLDLFMGQFAAEAVLVRDRDDGTRNDIEAIRELFRRSVEGRQTIEVENRMTIGRHVVDLARVTDTGVGGATSFLTIYDVLDGKIVRVHLLGGEITSWP